MKWNESHHFKRWSVLSNAMFIILGLSGIYELKAAMINNRVSSSTEQSERYQKVEWLYTFMIGCGICSGFHHAMSKSIQRYSILIDWFPITLSLLVLFCPSPASMWSFGIFDVFTHMQWTTFFKVVCSLFVMTTDYLCPILPQGWGHSIWHVLAAFSLDSLYKDLLLL